MLLWDSNPQSGGLEGYLCLLLTQESEARRGAARSCRGLG